MTAAEVNPGDLIALGSGDSTVIGNVLDVQTDPETGARDFTRCSPRSVRWARQTR